MIVFAGADHREMLSHHLLYGAAGISEAAGISDVRVSWSQSMNPRPQLSGDGLTAESLAELVREHARRCATAASWLQAPSPLDPKRAVMSPRLSAVGDDPERWRVLQRARHDVEDSLEPTHDALSAALIGALGEPSYWHRHRNGNRLQDDAASRLEMQPRNQGSEFVGSRLRGLATVVAARTVDEIRTGLLGEQVVDEMGKGSADSRTATNLRPPGPTDSAVAWVALWGITQTELVHRVGAASATATHLPRGTSRDPRAGRFTLPLWTRPWTPAKLRAVLAGGELAAAATVLRDAAGGSPGATLLATLRRRHGIGALVWFPVETFGSTSAPERRAMGGNVVTVPG